ncbi:MAG TPA: YdjY domain-containing protein [Desulfobacteria bacterium]|nr:YdjY domain-containing protein [Desulfobacteria bacterium]
MKTILKLILVSGLILGMALLAGCGQKASQTGNSETNSTEQTKTKADSVDGLTKENPIKVDKENGTVTFLAAVNGKYTVEPTRHGAVFEGGSNGQKSIFKGFVETQPLYDALMEIGAKPGNNMTLENKEKTNVAGDALEVTVTWNGAGKEYKLDEVVKDSTGKPIVIKFGGNIKASLDKKTGCLICLDSCPVGITSNTNYTYGAVEKRKEVGFTGNKDLLPADGGLVAVKLTFRK